MKNSYVTNLNLKAVDLGLLLLRVAAAALLLTHGYPKLKRFFGDEEITFMNFLGLGETVTLGLAVFAEFICSILVIFGLGTRLAVIPIMATMSVAAFYVHAADPFGRKELPILYLVIFLTLLITGAGKYSLDFFWLKKKSHK